MTRWATAATVAVPLHIGAAPCVASTMLAGVLCFRRSASSALNFVNGCCGAHCVVVLRCDRSGLACCFCDCSFCLRSSSLFTEAPLMFFPTFCCQCFFRSVLPLLSYFVCCSSFLECFFMHWLLFLLLCVLFVCFVSCIFQLIPQLFSN